MLASTLLLLVVVGCASTPPAPSPPLPPPSTPPPSAISVDTLYTEGLAALAVGELEVAVDHLEAATLRAPNDLLIGTDYRQAVIALAASRRPRERPAIHDRAIAVFERLTAEHPDASNAYLNLAFAEIDKLPTVGALFKLPLAKASLDHFGTALEIEESWLGHYSRGKAQLYWPPAFGRVPGGIADLERAIEIARAADDSKPYYARGWVTLGDGHWRGGDVEAARETWRRGLAIHPGDPELLERVALDDEALDAFLEAHFDPEGGVRTHLREIYGDRLAPYRSARESSD